jgi:hypothetical protein
VKTEVTSNLDDVLTVKAFVKRYPDLGKTDKAIYWDIFNSKYNGLDDCGAILRKGRRVWIVVPNYRDWLFSQHV